MRISALMGLSAHGAFVGVAGCDMRISNLAKKLDVDVPGFRRAYLVTEDGKVAVSQTIEATVLKDVKNQDDDIDLPSVENRELASKIAASERGGYVDAGDRLLVFSRLVSPQWTYVVELDRASYIE